MGKHFSYFSVSPLPKYVAALSQREKLCRTPSSGIRMRTLTSVLTEVHLSTTAELALVTGPQNRK